ncbi:MAG: sugar phosphate isomerase/epimerase family protein [Actinoallomurus sp.]
MTLRFGYGTNGFANHRLEDALAVIADLGYEGVALTLDHAHLDPYAPDLSVRTRALARRLDRLGLAVVIETGARYLLDRTCKHAPTLLSEDGRERRIELLTRAVRIGADLGAEAVSFWSGVKDPAVPDATAWDRLRSGCARVLTAADEADVTLGFEPEPGMFVEDLDGYDRLCAELGHPARFGLTLDIGHCRCLESLPVADCVRRAGSRVVNVQIDDMRRGVHEHLEFGTGEIDFPPVLAALDAIGYRGLVAVELPRHSHAAPDVCRRSLDFLRAAEERTGMTGSAGRTGEHEEGVA